MIILDKNTPTVSFTDPWDEYFPSGTKSAGGGALARTAPGGGRGGQANGGGACSPLCGPNRTQGPGLAHGDQPRRDQAQTAISQLD